jgi:hypothetical protein
MLTSSVREIWKNTYKQWGGNNMATLKRTELNLCAWTVIEGTPEAAERSSWTYPFHVSLNCYPSPSRILPYFPLQLSHYICSLECREKLGKCGGGEYDC